MNLRRIIPSDMTASVVAHLSLLALLLLFSDVHPFGAVATESIAVEIVAPQDIPEQQDLPEKAAIEKTPEPVPTPTPQLDFTALDKPAPLPAPAPTAQQPPPAPKQKQAAMPAPRAAPQPAAPPPAAAAAAPAYRQPEPDLTLKYNVLLGLPPDMRPPPSASSSGAKAGDDFDAPAIQNAEVASSVVAAFRQHLRTCSKLAAGLKAADDVKVKLRVFMGRDGRLSAEPVLIEASASMKGPLLMQSAISALQACQPYAMLPVDRYGEWKVLDLSFTPQDFAGA